VLSSASPPPPPSEGYFCRLAPPLKFKAPLITFFSPPCYPFGRFVADSPLPFKIDSSSETAEDLLFVGPLLSTQRILFLEHCLGWLSPKLLCPFPPIDCCSYFILFIERGLYTFSCSLFFPAPLKTRLRSPAVFVSLVTPRLLPTCLPSPAPAAVPAYSMPTLLLMRFPAPVLLQLRLLFLTGKLWSDPTQLPAPLLAAFLKCNPPVARTVLGASSSYF